jgi:hypothetical protein
MDETQEHIASSAGATTELDELREQHAGLRRQMVNMLILVIILSGALNMFLLRQYTYARKDLANVRPQAQQVINAYKKDAPIMGEFVRRLAEYGKTHPDFEPIVTKYNLHPQQAQAPAGAPSAAAPAPAPAQPAQK